MSKVLTAVVCVFVFAGALRAQVAGAMPSSELRELVIMSLWFEGHERPFKSDLSQWFSDRQQKAVEMEGEEGDLQRLGELPSHVLYEIYTLEREMVYEQHDD